MAVEVKDCDCFPLLSGSLTQSWDHILFHLWTKVGGGPENSPSVDAMRKETENLGSGLETGLETNKRISVPSL